MKTENWKDKELDPKNKMAEPSEEQQLEGNHVDTAEKTRVTEVEEDEEDDSMEESEDDDDDVKNQVNQNQNPERNANLEQNRSEVDTVNDVEGAESNKITNRETEIVNKEGQ
ncbi:MAG: hypothetical protein K0S32_950 [Bacteroidetes bacterium]|jgi:hypothetical protein|nr:hypothetical protein [Bacteroidota bacterium]